jgi:hypothetical protein
MKEVYLIEEDMRGVNTGQQEWSQHWSTRMESTLVDIIEVYQIEEDMRGVNTG